MATTRTLTFRSRDLGVDVSLMLCFTPPSPTLYKDHFPVAWKVTMLGASGGSVMTATYVANYSVCSAQIEGSGSEVIAGTYTPIGPGQMTTLTQRPGGYAWSKPETVGGTVIRAKNGTDHIMGIGAGFITDEGSIRENMTPAVVYDSVAPQLTVNAEFTPVCSAYISMDYRVNQIVRSEVIGVDPIWQANLLGLQPTTTIWIRRTPQGGFVAEVASASVGSENDIPRGLDFSVGWTRMYCATLAFENSAMIQGSLKAIMKELLGKGYSVKVVTKENDKTARLELTLPPNTSCDQAEKDMLGGVQIQIFPRPVAIQERRGELMAFSAGNVSWWSNINPAGMEWYISKNPKEIENAEPYESGYLTPSAPERYAGNTRLARKPSTSGFSNGYAA